MDRNEAIKVIKHNWPEGRHRLSEALKTLIPELNESDDERIIQAIGYAITNSKHEDGTILNGVTENEALSWLEKVTEEVPRMIQWKGDNLKEVVEFTGKSHKFGEWFKTWEEYENYVHSHGDIFKLFDEAGNHYEVPVGAWIVKTPDGYNAPSKAKYKHNSEQKPADKIEPKFKIGDTIVEKDLDECGCGTIVNIKDGKYIFDDGFFIRIKEQDLWQLVEQKPTLSEKDERRISYVDSKK